nr:OmpA family protein [Photobacterium galatheae]
MDDLVIRKKRREIQPEEPGGGWKIALADFMCALMITFFSLWAIGQQDQQNKQLLADYFKGEKINQEEKMALLDTTFAEIKEMLDEQGILVTMDKNSKGIVIKFDSSSLFESGSAELKQKAKHALTTLASGSEHTGLFFHIYGYTDNIPVRAGSVIENNLLLSVMRATEAARAVIDGGISSNRVTIHGEGLLNNEDSENTAEARRKNRRVELYMSYSSAPHKIYGKNVTYTQFEKENEKSVESLH